jgi:hypothetical protein
MTQRKTISIPKELQDAMKFHPEINWSKVAQNTFREELKKIEILSNNADITITFSGKYQLGITSVKIEFIHFLEKAGFIFQEDNDILEGKFKPDGNNRRIVIQERKLK